MFTYEVEDMQLSVVGGAATWSSDHRSMRESGIAALEGDPDRSRDLLASAVDVDPRSASAHTRMVALYRAAGNRDLRCAHALARALVSARDWRHQVAAARCDNDVQRHLSGASFRDASAIFGLVQTRAGD